MPVVINILGVGAESVEKRVGNLAARASGVQSRFVLVVDCTGLVALAVAVCLVDALSESIGSSESPSLAESIMLSLSSSELGTTSTFSSKVACSSSSFRRFA